MPIHICYYLNRNQICTLVSFHITSSTLFYLSCIIRLFISFINIFKYSFIFTIIHSFTSLFIIHSFILTFTLGLFNNLSTNLWNYLIIFYQKHQIRCEFFIVIYFEKFTSTFYHYDCFPFLCFISHYIIDLYILFTLYCSITLLFSTNIITPSFLLLSLTSSLISFLYFLSLYFITSSKIKIVY